MRRPVLCLMVIASGVLAGSVAGADPQCFGAAARAPGHPCRNPALDHVVRPTPWQALRLPNASCHPPRDIHRVPFACTFGAPEAGARAQVAMLGDSHAMHWRPALGPVAAQRGWLGFSLTRRSCPFSTAVPDLPPYLQSKCVRWRQTIPGWMRRHPEVHTVFVSEHRAGIVGASGLGAEIGGYESAWRLLPRSVHHIVVIRDTPMNTHATRRCVIEAMRRHQRPGTECAEARVVALGVDPAALAAHALGSRRVRVVDMTRFMCSAHLCFPVVGGALVYKNFPGHLTATFAATMAPYLGWAVRHALR